MDKLELFGKQNVDKAFGEGTMKGIKVMGFALGNAALIYGVVAFFVSRPLGEGKGPGVDPVLMAVFGGLAAMMALMSQVIPDMMTRRRIRSALAGEGIDTPQGTLTEAADILGYLVRAGMLTRLAMIESVAIFGLVLVFLMDPQERGWNNPLFLACFADFALVSLAIQLSVPSRDRIDRMVNGWRAEF